MNKERILGWRIVLVIIASAFTSCDYKKNSNDDSNDLLLPIIYVDTTTASNDKECMGSIEGKINMESRAQVEGILEQIFVDEGYFVQEGQPFFQIDVSAYREINNNALANENVEKAKLRN